MYTTETISMQIILISILIVILIIMLIMLALASVNFIKNLICWIKTEINAKHWRKTIIEYLDNYADVHNKERQENYLETLEKYCKMVHSKGYELQFREGRLMNPQSLNGNAGIFKKSPIIITPQWAAQLVFDDREETRNAFEITIGHELAHKKDLWSFRNGVIYFRLTKMLNEIRADFNSINELAEINEIEPKDRHSLIAACKYKRNFEVNILKQKDIKGCFHPPWSKRIDYSTKYNFDEDLIKEIAKNTHYNWYIFNFIFINFVVKNYADRTIYLATLEEND